MDWHDVIRNKLRTALLAVAATLAPFGPASDARAGEPAGLQTPSTILPHLDAAGIIRDTVRELQIAAALLEAFEASDAQEFRLYLEELDVAMATYDGPSPSIVLASVVRLSSNLRAARDRFEQDLTNLAHWRQFAEIVRPRRTVLRVPERFVRRVDREPEYLQPWTDEECRAWMTDLDE